MVDKFRELAQRIFLSPSEEVLEDCATFVEKAKDDIALLKSIDTSNTPINYSPVDEVWKSGTLQAAPYPEMENAALIKFLVEDYAIPNIKKSS